MLYAIFGLPALKALAGFGVKWAINKIAKDITKKDKKEED